MPSSASNILHPFFFQNLYMKWILLSEKKEVELSLNQSKSRTKIQVKIRVRVIIILLSATTNNK